MRVCVTGAAGPSGAPFAEHLAGAGEMVGFDNLSMGDRRTPTVDDEPVSRADG